MIHHIVRIVLSLLATSMGLGIGIGIANIKFLETYVHGGWEFIALQFVLPSIIGLILGIIIYIFSPQIIIFGIKIAKNIENELSHIPTSQLILGGIGMVFGLMIAYFVSNLYKIIPFKYVGDALTVLTYIFLGYLGISLAKRDIPSLHKITDMFKRDDNSSEEAINIEPATENSMIIDMKARSKILDTSVIIDGRIADVAKTGFIEGVMLVPEFVLKELQHIADSSDDLKRNRGRRGLDILKNMQNDKKILVEISAVDFEDISEVDMKLLKLAKKIDGIVVTNDYNLNKVASLQGVQILNVNELANAVKSIVLPGENMMISIVKEGKENNQGIGYLDDGTMIVIENGRRFINQNKNVKVTSVLQTSAGRMIFAKPD